MNRKTGIYIKRFCSDLRQALPVILFFIVLFYGVIFVFGTQYILTVSVITTAFRINFQKRLTWKRTISIAVEQMLMCVLAFFATLNIPLCIALNAAVPFFLVVLRTTRFNQRGYFVNAMAFVFLQLRPVGWKGFASQLIAYCSVAAALAAALELSLLFGRKRTEYEALREGFEITARRFWNLSEGKRIKGISMQMASVQNSFHAGAAGGSLSYIFALLFQRTAYFILDYQQDRSGFGEADRDLFRTMALFMDDVESGLNSFDNEVLIQRAGEILNETDEASETFQIYVRNFLHLLVMGLKLITDEKEKSKTHTIDWHRFWNEKKERLHPKQFEMRFALRLSLVLLISFVLSTLLDINHSYWLPLNAFLLVQPMYEESTRRLKNRVIGTILGSLVVFFLLMQLKSMTAHFILATIMVSFMYSFVPGNVLQVFFSTGFALTLASLTLKSTTAIELRLAYVAGAVLLVLLANKFCFPTSLYGQFKFNMREVLHMEENYLNFLEVGSRRSIDYEVMSDALAQFNLTYGQAMEYLGKEQQAEMEKYRELLNTLWRMVSEVEQMVFYVTTEQIEPAQSEQIKLFVTRMKKALKLSAKSGNKEEKDTEEAAVIPECGVYLEHLMGQYIENVSKLRRIYRQHPALAQLFPHA